MYIHTLCNLCNMCPYKTCFEMCSIRPALHWCRESLSVQYVKLDVLKTHDVYTEGINMHKLTTHGKPL